MTSTVCDAGDLKWWAAHKTLIGDETSFQRMAQNWTALSCTQLFKDWQLQHKLYIFKLLKFLILLFSKKQFVKGNCRIFWNV
jgi:hypothetical protein